MKIDKFEFGTRLRKFRTGHALSQAELAEVLETTQGNIGHIENGRRKPGPDVLLNLYVHFQDEFRYLLLGSHIPEPRQRSGNHSQQSAAHLAPIRYPDDYIKSQLQTILRTTMQALEHIKTNSSQT